MQTQTWLITGCSSGIGAALARELLSRGCTVIATARSLDSMGELMAAGASCLQLDLSASQEELDATINMAEAMHGPIDVLVNNGGYAEVGILENTGIDVFQRQYDTNIFGTLKVTRAIIPFFRIRKSGTIVFMSSSTGIVGPPGASPYASSKFAIEGIADCLHTELSPLSIRVLVVEPGMFRTESLTPRSHVNNNSTSLPEYAGLERRMEAAHGMQGVQRGCPAKLAAGLVDVIRGEGKHRTKQMPRNLVMGRDAVEMIRGRLQERLKDLDEWERLASGLDV